MGAAPIREGIEVVESVVSFVLRKRRCNPSEVVVQPIHGRVTLRIFQRNPVEIAGLPSSKRGLELRLC